jgi:hypothetical protein
VPETGSVRNSLALKQRTLLYPFQALTTRRHLTGIHCNGNRNGHFNCNDNGYVNGHANGHDNGHANGHANGHDNGHANRMPPAHPRHRCRPA